MKTQCRQVTRIQDTFSIHLDAESMSSVIDYFQSIFICNFLNSFSITWLSVYMHRHNSGSIGSDSCFNLIRVNIARSRIYINKYRLNAIPPQTMGSSNKTIRSSNYFTLNTQCLQSSDKGESTIGKQTKIRDFQISRQLFFELSMKGSIVCNPFAGIYVSNHLLKLFQRR